MYGFFVFTPNYHKVSSLFCRANTARYGFLLNLVDLIWLVAKLRRLTPERVRQAGTSQTQTSNTDVSRDRYRLNSYTAVTDVRSGQGGACFSRNGAGYKQVTRSIPWVAALLWSQQDASRYLLICTDCGDTDTAADVSYRPTRTVTPSGAPSQSHLLSCIRNKTSRRVYIKPVASLITKRSTREGELKSARGPTAHPTFVETCTQCLTPPCTVYCVPHRHVR
jgi:hypothetical protein